MRFIFTGFILFQFFQLLAQQETVLIFHLDKTSIKYEAVKDSTNFARYKQKALNRFALEGYTGIELSDSTQQKNTIHYYCTSRNKFEHVALINQYNEDVEKLKNLTQTPEHVNSLLQDLENNGYPFAQIKFTHESEENKTLNLYYKIDSGMFFVIDKITIRSKTKFHEPTVLNLINLETGTPYDEEKILKAGLLLSSGGLYKLIRPAEVVFRQNGKAEIFLYIERRNASSADGFVGFQQDNISGKLKLNGYLNLSLVNSFHRGEQFSMNWKNNPQNTQQLKLFLQYPYILKTPLGIGTKLDLRKQDSSFVRADAFFELAYLNPFYKFGVFYQHENSTTILKTTPADLRDYQKNTYGTSIRYRPTFTGKAAFYHPTFEVSGGFFTFKTDSTAEEYPLLSNSKYLMRYSHQLSILNYFFIFNSIQYEGLTSAYTLSRNEKIFFGGLNSIRGFYELELNGNDVILINNEIGFIPVKAIEFKLLYDYASFHSTQFYQVQSIGLGFGFISGNIKLELLIANGWYLKTNPILSNTKIHLGIRSVF
ncbi:MAG: hypothetical protein IPH66_04610 [Crocinitomicaceae bacterium]|nr:hypothetical protein [Crocinitomicaceae bacterium]